MDAQQKSDGADILSQLSNADLEDARSGDELPKPLLKDWRVATIGQAFTEDLFNAPMGGAFDVAGQQPANAYSRTLKAFQYAYPKFPLVGRAPTADELTHFAERDDRFKPIWAALRQAQQQSHVLAAEQGEGVDWGAREKAHLDQTFDEIAALHAQGKKSEPGNWLPQKGDTEGQLRYAFNTSIPGRDRPPLSDQDIASMGWDAIKAANSEDVDRLPVIVRGLARGLATGAKFAAMGPASRGFMGGAAFEGVNQALSVASGQQKEFDPEKIIESGLTMKIAGAAGEGAAAAFPRLPQTAATIGTLGAFEAAGAAQKLAAPKPRFEEPQKGTPLERFVAHVVETAATLGVAGAVSRLMETPKEAPKKPSEPGEMTDFKAAYLTAKAFGKKIDERIPALDEHAKEVLADANLKTAQAEQNLTTLIHKAFKGSKARSDAEVAARIIVESEGRLPLPEGFKPPKEWEQILAATREVGAAGLGYGRLMHEAKRADGTPWLPWARYDTPGTGEVIVQRKGDPEPMESARLTGGLKYAEEHGFYFPQSNEGVAAPEDAGMAPPARAAATRGKAPLEGLAAAHLKKRELPFEEAYKERPLDLSLRKAMEVYSAQGEALQRYHYLDHAEATGLLVSKEQLPDQAARQKMALEIDGVRKDIQQLGKDIKNFPREQRVEIRRRLYQKQAQLAALKLASKEKLYQELDESYGPFAGKYLHRDAKQQFEARYGDTSSASYILQSLRSMGKSFRVAWDPSQYLKDMIGNWRSYAKGGIRNVWGQIPHSWAVNLKLKQGDHLDAVWDQLEKGEAFGGPADYTAVDAGRIRRINAKIAENLRQGKGAKGLQLARLLEQRGRLIEQANAWVDDLPPGVRQAAIATIKAPLNVMHAVPKFRQALVDRAFARAAFRQAVKYGVMDSGPMTPKEAFDWIQHIADFRVLSKTVQNTAKFADFLRWPSMVGHALVTRQGLLKPSVLGVDIPTPLDPIIRSDPGSPAAKAALVTRGMLRIAVSAAQGLAFLGGLRAAGAKHAGISLNSLDEKLNAKFNYLPAPVRWLVVHSFIPYGKNALGEAEGIDAAQFVPEIAAMRYFSLPVSVSEIAKNPSRAAGDIIKWILGKNMLTGAVSQVASKENFAGQPVGEGFGPGKRFWPIESFFLPAAPVHALEEFARQQNLPPAERNALRDFALKSLAGLPVQMVADRGKIDIEIQRLVDEGTISRVVNEQTGEFHYEVTRPNTYEGWRADRLMKLRKELYGNTPAALVKRLYYQSQKRLESMGAK